MKRPEDAVRDDSGVTSADGKIFFDRKNFAICVQQRTLTENASSDYVLRWAEEDAPPVARVEEDFVRPERKKAEDSTQKGPSAQFQKINAANSVHAGPHRAVSQCNKGPFHNPTKGHTRLFRNAEENFISEKVANVSLESVRMMPATTKTRQAKKIAVGTRLCL